MTTEKKQELKVITTFNIYESADMQNLSAELAKFIKNNKLFQNIQGKEYVNVEGWQYAGSRCGIFPKVKNVKNISSETELKYSASVELIHLQSNNVVGAGVAICSNKEQGKKFYQEFAIASMAQTRAIGKAFRNELAFLIRMAGFEPTPAEEMEYGGNAPEVKTENIGAGSVVSIPVTTEAAEPDFEGHKVMNEKSNKIKAEQGQQAAAANIAQGNANAANSAKQSDTPTEPAVKYASAKQKEEIIRLLNNPVITRQEKTKMLLNINKLDEDRAAQAIAKLRKVIEEREEQTAAA